MLVPNLKNSVLLFSFPITHALSHIAVTGMCVIKFQIEAKQKKKKSELWSTFCQNSGPVSSSQAPFATWLFLQLSIDLTSTDRTDQIKKPEGKQPNQQKSLSGSVCSTVCVATAKKTDQIPKTKQTTRQISLRVGLQHSWRCNCQKN